MSSPFTRCHFSTFFDNIMSLCRDSRCYCHCHRQLRSSPKPRLKCLLKFPFLRIAASLPGCGFIRHLPTSCWGCYLIPRAVSVWQTAVPPDLLFLTGDCKHWQQFHQLSTLTLVHFNSNHQIALFILLEK